MIEDKLGHGERLRLECLSQSVAITMGRSNESAEQIVQRAKEFENYIIGSGQQSA